MKLWGKRAALKPDDDFSQGAATGVGATFILPCAPSTTNNSSKFWPLAKDFLMGFQVLHQVLMLKYS